MRDGIEGFQSIRNVFKALEQNVLRGAKAVVRLRGPAKLQRSSFVQAIQPNVSLLEMLTIQYGGRQAHTTIQDLR
ncbi:unnamed protein product [Sympodiomycopsis kandeliae]